MTFLRLVDLSISILVFFRPEVLAQTYGLSDFIIPKTTPTPQGSAKTAFNGPPSVQGISLPTLSFTASKDTSCFKEWRNTYMPKLRSYMDRLPKVQQFPMVTTFYEKYYYKTIESFGQGEVYTACDGIPRFRLTGPITALKTRDIVVTRRSVGTSVITRTLASPAVSSKESEPSKPTCALPGRVCRDIFAIYAFLASNGMHLDPTDHLLSAIACETVGSCKIKLPQDVLLFYWPMSVTSRDICAANGYGNGTLVVENDPITSTMDEITFSAQALQLLSSSVSGTLYPAPTGFIRASTISGNWTLTSPTVYLAHPPITADLVILSVTFTSGEPSTVEIKTVSIPIRHGGVIELHTSDLSTIQPIHHNTKVKDGIEYAKLVAKGAFDPMITSINFADPDRSPKLETTRPFNPLHLEDPVPASLYFDARSDDCWGTQTHCGTITDETYNPRLIINGDVFARMAPRSYLTWNLDGVDCTVPTLVEPPLALRRMRFSQEPPKALYDSPSHEVPVTQTASNSIAKPTGHGPGVAEPEPEVASSNPRDSIKPHQARPGGSFLTPAPSQTATVGA